MTTPGPPAERVAGRTEDKPDTPARANFISRHLMVLRFSQLTEGNIRLSDFLAWVRVTYSPHVVYDCTLSEWNRTVASSLARVGREVTKDVPAKQHDAERAAFMASMEALSLTEIPALTKLRRNATASLARQMVLSGKDRHYYPKGYKGFPSTPRKPIFAPSTSTAREFTSDRVMSAPQVENAARMGKERIDEDRAQRCKQGGARAAGEEREQTCEQKRERVTNEEWEQSCSQNSELAEMEDGEQRHLQSLHDTADVAQLAVGDSCSEAADEETEPAVGFIMNDVNDYDDGEAYHGSKRSRHDDGGGRAVKKARVFPRRTPMESDVTFAYRVLADIEARGLIKRDQKSACRRILSEEVKLGLTAALVDYAVSNEVEGCDRTQADQNITKYIGEVAPAPRSPFQKAMCAVANEVKRTTMRTIVNGVMTAGYVAIGVCLARVANWQGSAALSLKH